MWLSRSFQGQIVTFDGLVDGAGRVVLCTSHVCDNGIMQIRQGELGGFTPEMMSAAGDCDVFELWAALVSGGPPDDFTHQRRYFTAHAGRRAHRKYKLPAAELERELGNTLFAVEPVPAAFAATMGNVAYLLRHPELDALRAAVTLVQS